MEHRLKKWELALAAGVVMALIWGAGTARVQADLADRMIRLHIVANSDSPWDQELKLTVRDAVLERVEELSAGCTDAGELEGRLKGSLEELERLGEEVLRQAGCPCNVRAGLERCRFPTRQYGGFALPAGEYKALRVVIGAGEGENWWCVAFPPLCVGAGMGEVEQAVQTGVFTKEQADLITGQGGQWQLRFRSIELLEELKSYFLQALG